MAREKETFRIFAATYLEDKSSLADYNTIQKNFEDFWHLKLKWVPSENLHLTWKFLGCITQSRIERVYEQLNKIKSEFKPMKLQFKELAIWPNGLKPRQIVWLGTDLEDNIKVNFKIMDKSFCNVGFQKEKRPFKPHITLGRFKIKAGLESAIFIPEELELEPVQFEIKKISILKSELKPEGPIYKSIKNIIL